METVRGRSRVAGTGSQVDGRATYRSGAAVRCLTAGLGESQPAARAKQSSEGVHSLDR